MPPSDTSIAAIVLAAGRSTRMGAHKLLLPLGGRPLVSYAVAAACASRAAPVVVVLGHDAEAVRVALPPHRQRYVINDAFASGMASSLRAGIAALPPSATGALVLLADQPLVTATLVDEVLAGAATHPEQIVAATYGGVRSHPVYFPRTLFAELAAVAGDEGGRSVLARHADLVRLLPLEPAAAALDVDRPGDYERVVAAWG
jgi:molybdenum cofactor cytidylyltransferase